MLSRLSRIVICKYADDVPIERLQRHHRIAFRICLIGFGSGALMVSTLAGYMGGGREGWLRTISTALLLGSTAVFTVIIVPAVFAVAWAAEIEKELANRGWPLPDRERVEVWIPLTAMKTVYWFLVLLLIVWFAQR